MFARVVLLLAVVMFAGFGCWLVLDPDRLDVWLGIRAERLEGRTELRAFYGGLEIGLAAFLLLSAFRPAWQAPALALVLAIHVAIAAARCYGFWVDGSVSGKLLSFLGVELGFAVTSLLALLRQPAPTH